ncbi:MAG TPA: hypothetical protein VF355_03570 [Anaerolineaceae bacterium]
MQQTSTISRIIAFSFTHPRPPPSPSQGASVSLEFWRILSRREQEVAALFAGWDFSAWE